MHDMMTPEQLRDNVDAYDRSPLLTVEDLHTYFFTDDGIVKAVNGVNFSVRRGEVFGIVGESGCGKSVTAMSILRLIDRPGRIMAGRIGFAGESLLGMPEAKMKRLRGRRISMISQEPHASLNPVFTIGDQIAETFQIHLNLSKKKAWIRAVDLLRQVEIPEPERKAHAYPHQISGGQAQRVLIATALALDPELLIADEPTTALDVTIQAQILDLIRTLTREHNTSVILITHDLGVVAEICDRVAVMYAGQIVEQGSVTELFDRPLHPYTKGLIDSMPVLGHQKQRLNIIPGSVPDLVDMPPGCRFASRCTAKEEYNCAICTEVEPDLIEELPGHAVRCWLYRSHGDHVAPLVITELDAVPRTTVNVESGNDL